VEVTSVKDRGQKKLNSGCIQVAKHSYAVNEGILDCDLLIVDEAHRAKGEMGQFSMALRRATKKARRVLILTATPFSIRLEELGRMLSFVGGQDARPRVKAFSDALDRFYSGSGSGDHEKEARKLSGKANEAIDALSAYVIRNSADSLKSESKAFGKRQDWEIIVPPAKEHEIELLIRMDRALRVEKRHEKAPSNMTNDPRFHVGWKYLEREAKRLKDALRKMDGLAKAVIWKQVKSVLRLLPEAGTHTKLRAIGECVKSKIEAGEKVLLFCHHHATAQELTEYIGLIVPDNPSPASPHASFWGSAWKGYWRGAHKRTSGKPLSNGSARIWCVHKLSDGCATSPFPGRVWRRH
jgi:ERCC4-related helicase